MEWKKIGLVSVMLLALTSLGIAWEVGDKITPIQFAAIDFTEHPFNPTPTGNEIIGTGTEALYRVNYSIESYKKNSDTEYEKEKASRQVQYEIQSYATCRADGNTESECNTVIKDWAIIEITNRVEKEEEDLIKEQAVAEAIANYASELEAGDITITTAEIDAAIAARKAAQVE